MQKAVFLDRDGIINKELGDYVTQLNDFEILPHVTECLNLLQEAGFLLIVITNQGGIAKGLYTHDELHKMHHFFLNYVGSKNIAITEIFYCPHHPDYTNCLCRKPKSLLVEKAISKYEIDVNKSFFIGDKDRDMQAANAVGVKGILVPSNHNWINEAKNICKFN